MVSLIVLLYGSQRHARTRGFIALCLEIETDLINNDQSARHVMMDEVMVKVQTWWKQHSFQPRSFGSHRGQSRYRFNTHIRGLRASTKVLPYGQETHS